jgi:pimeloyl-ACP methyl ester carboxylesterase
LASIILIPGAGGEAFDWNWVRPLLEERGHDVVAVDLPAGDESAGIDEYADTVIAAIGNREAPVLVAQSMGGFTAAAVAERIPVRLIVFVNAMVPNPGETAGEWWMATGQAAAERSAAIADGRDPDAEFDVVETFFHDVPLERVAEVMARPVPSQSNRPFGSSVGDGWKHVPTRAIAGSLDRMFPLPMMQAMYEERLGIEPDVIESGHMTGHSRPEELAELISRYIEELG